MTRVVLSAARLATPAVLHEPGWLVLDGATITDCGGGPPPGPGVDLGDRTLAPGFVDVHVHGADGAQVNGGSPDEVAEAVTTLATFHARHGTTALVATTVSDTPSRLRASVAGVARSAVLGCHLEGPWLSPDRRGAHDPALLRSPDVGELRSLLDAADGTLRIVTVAPELHGADDLIRAAVDAGLLVSIGHTAADLSAVRRAFDLGARHVTHLFNGMPGLHHRDPGPVAAALEDPRVSVEVIADGRHVDPSVLSLVARLLPGRLVAVTDATAATGLPPGSHRLGAREVTVSDGRVTLADDRGTLAGSVLTLDRAVALLVHEADVPLTSALAAASTHPARAVGATGKGELRPGADADLVVLSPGLEAEATVLAGRVVHDPAGLLRSVAR